MMEHRNADLTTAAAAQFCYSKESVYSAATYSPVTETPLARELFNAEREIDWTIPRSPITRKDLKRFRKACSYSLAIVACRILYLVS